MADHEHKPYLTKRGTFCVTCDIRMGPSIPTKNYPYGKGNQGPGTGPDGERLI